MSWRKTSRGNTGAQSYLVTSSDGGHSLLDVAERAGLPFAVVADAASALLDVDLLEERQP